MQDGSHDELILKKGVYAEMFNTQKQWYVQREPETRYVYFGK